MRFLRLHSFLIVVLGLALSMFSNPSLGQDKERPDLTGTWSNASRTSLTRPQNTELVVSPEQAQTIVENLSIAGISRENIENGPAIDQAQALPLQALGILVYEGTTYFGQTLAQHLHESKGNIGLPT